MRKVYYHEKGEKNAEEFNKRTDQRMGGEAATSRKADAISGTIRVNQASLRRKRTLDEVRRGTTYSARLEDRGKGHISTARSE